MIKLTHNGEAEKWAHENQLSDYKKCLGNECVTDTYILFLSIFTSSVFLFLMIFVEPGSLVFLFMH